MGFAIYMQNYFIFTEICKTMKKYFLLFAAGGLLTLASCGGETKPTEAPINADSLAKAKVDSATAAMKAENEAAMAAKEKAVSDSLAMVAKADSIAKAEIAAAEKHTTTAKKAVTHKATTKAAPTAAPAPNSKSKWDDNAGKTEKKADPSKTDSKSKWD